MVEGFQGSENFRPVQDEYLSAANAAAEST